MTGRRAVDVKVSAQSVAQRGVAAGALIALSIGSRLPQLLGPNLLLDGDESWLGLLAKHVAEGREFPLFFYGQHYGLATVEASAGALAFLIAGVHAIVLKAAILAVWTAGLIFVFLAVAKLAGAAASFWITSVLLLTPAWADASMNARGGYVTAFTASAALAWLLVRDDGRGPYARWALAGVLVGLICLAQPLWIPGVAPMVVASLAQRRSPIATLICAVAAAAVIGGVTIAASAREAVHPGPPLVC